MTLAPRPVRGGPGSSQSILPGNSGNVLTDTMSPSATVVRIALPVMPSEVSYDDRWAGAAPSATAGESSRRSPGMTLRAGSSPGSTEVGIRRGPSDGVSASDWDGSGPALAWGEPGRATDWGGPARGADWGGPARAAESSRTGWTPGVGVDERGRGAGVPGRRTVTITGHGEEAWHSRNGTRPSRAARHQNHLKRHERAGFRPDRVAMWAVLLGVMLMLAAAASSHAAVLVAHHAATLLRVR